MIYLSFFFEQSSQVKQENDYLNCIIYTIDVKWSMFKGQIFSYYLRTASLQNLTIASIVTNQCKCYGNFNNNNS